MPLRLPDCCTRGHCVLHLLHPLPTLPIAAAASMVATRRSTRASSGEAGAGAAASWAETAGAGGHQGAWGLDGALGVAVQYAGAALLLVTTPAFAIYLCVAGRVGLGGGRAARPPRAALGAPAAIWGWRAGAGALFGVVLTVHVPRRRRTRP